MALFGGTRDISLFRTLNRELINDLVDILSLVNPNSQDSLAIFNWMKYPFSLIYGSGEYVVVLLCSFSSLLLISKISYSKFPILKFGLDFSNSISIIGILFFCIILLIGVINKQYHIVMLFFISYYILFNYVQEKGDGSRLFKTVS